MPFILHVRFLDKNAIQQKPYGWRALRPFAVELSAPPVPDFPFLADFWGRVNPHAPPHFIEAEFQNYGSAQRV